MEEAPVAMELASRAERFGGLRAAPSAVACAAAALPDSSPVALAFPLAFDQNTLRWVSPGTSSCTCRSSPSNARSSTCYEFQFAMADPAAGLLCLLLCTHSGRRYR